MHNTIVMKFGGTSVGTPERIHAVAERIRKTCDSSTRAVIVTSAMAGDTDRLIDLFRTLCPDSDQDPDLLAARDTTIAAGEQIAAGLLAGALRHQGLKARPVPGWQIPIHTSNRHGAATITSVETGLLERMLACGVIPVITGFQGVSGEGAITTLGRGGSDLSAVAIAVALRAGCCDIYTDVDGVYTADPRIVPRATRLAHISFEEMLEMSAAGARVLQSRSVKLAMRHGLRLRVLSSFADGPGTLITSEDRDMERAIISGVTSSGRDAKITLTDLPDRPGVAARVFSLLAGEGIPVDIIVQDVARNDRTSITLSVPEEDAARACDLFRTTRETLEFSELILNRNVAKISVVGVGMKSHSGVAATMFRTLADNHINIQAIATSDIKITVLTDARYLELAVRTLHDAFGLDRATDS